MLRSQVHLLKNLEDAKAVVSPAFPSALLFELFDGAIDFRSFETITEQTEGIILSGLGQAVDSRIDGGTQNRAAVVIQMIAQKLDPAGECGDRACICLRYSSLACSTKLFLFIPHFELKGEDHKKPHGNPWV